MKKILPVFIVLLIASGALCAQGVNVYTVTRQTGVTFSSISTSGTSVSSWRAGSNTDNNRSDPISLGFYFNYLGNLYNTISISTNGFIDFSSSSAQGYGSYPYGYDNSYFTVPAPDGTLLALAPFYEDLMVPWGGSINDAIKYQSTGSSGNKVFIVEWNNMTFPSAFAERVTFQVRLYESDSDIEFIYGSMSGASASLSYTCGINSATISTPPTSSQLLTQQTPNSATFSATPQNGLSTIPASNTKLVFNGCILPSAAGPITGSSIVCDPATAIAYSIPSVTGATGYSWTLPSGFSIASGNNTNSITVNVTGGTTGTISAAGTNSCGSGQAATLPVTVSLRPSPTISGPTTVCANTTGHTYTTQNGMSNYQWTVSSGGTIVSGQGTSFITVTWNTTGSQSVGVNYANAAGCSASSPASLSVTVNTNPVPTIAGSSSACAGSAGNVYTTQANMTNYQWTVSSGGTITSGGTSGSNSCTVTWNTAGAQTVGVSYTNSNGCTSGSPGVKNVTVNPLPTPTVSGPSSVCANSSGNIYTTQGGMTNYQWTISSGGNITGGYGTSAITVTWLTTGTKTVSVIYTSSNGCAALAPGIDTVQVNPRPAPTISGPASVCAGATGSVYTTETGMSNYQWTISSGGTITAGSGTSSITVNWTTPGNKTVTVNYANSYGCNALSATSYAVTVNMQPTITLTGPDTVCMNSTGNVYTTQSGNTAYQWTVSSGGTITAGGTATSSTCTVTWNMAGSQSVSVNYTNSSGCPAAAPANLPVIVNPLPVPAISGPATACINSTGNSYTTEAGMTGYTWTVSSGGTITSGQGTNAIQVTWSTSGAKTVGVTYTNSNGCNPSTPTSYPVTVSALPVPTISGPVSACQGSTTSVYYTEDGMNGYFWNVSWGGTITSGAGTDSITVTWNNTGAQTVSVSYTNTTGCTAATPTVKNITVHPQASPTIAGNTYPCTNSGNNSYSTQSGMTGYQWAVSSGGMILSGGSTNQIQVSWIGSGSQWVQVNYTNANGCSAPAPVTLPVEVQVSPGPAGTINGPDSICGGSVWIFTTDPVTGATSYNWNFPVGATITSGAGSQTVTVTFSKTASSGNVTVSGVNGCGTGALSVPHALHVSPTPTPVITQDFDKLISSVAMGNQWYLNGLPIEGATGQSYIATENGNYFAVISLNGCYSDTSNHIEVVVTGLAHPMTNLLSLYPIPCRTQLFISTPVTVTGKWEAEILDFYGKIAFRSTGENLTNSNILEVSLPPLPDGIYFFKLINSGKILTGKILISAGSE